MGRTRDLVEAAPSPVASNPLRVARHAVGSAYVLARTAVRVPSLLSIPPTGLLRRAFPAGLVTIGEGLSILDRELPRRWPDAGLWLTAYDLVHRRRVVLSARPAPYLALPEAVRSSARSRCLRPCAARRHNPRRWRRLVLHEPRPGTRRRVRRGGLRRARVYDPEQPPSLSGARSRHFTTLWLARGGGRRPPRRSPGRGGRRRGLIDRDPGLNLMRGTVSNRSRRSLITTRAAGCAGRRWRRGCSKPPPEPRRCSEPPPERRIRPSGPGQHAEHELGGLATARCAEADDEKPGGPADRSRDGVAPERRHRGPLPLLR